MEWLVDEASKEAHRRGYKVSVVDDLLEVSSPHSPLKVIVSRDGEGYVVALKTANNLQGIIEDIASESDDPRSEVESLLDEALLIVESLVRIIREKGFKVRRITRDAILDVYDALESLSGEEQD